MSGADKRDDDTSSKSKAWDFISSLTVDPLKKSIGAAVGALLVATAWTIWTVADGKITRYIGSAVVSELQKENGEITGAIRQTLANELRKDEGEIVGALRELFAKGRKSEVGAINVGSFALTPTNRSNTVLIYSPQKYTGKIFYQIKGNIIPDCKYVVLVPPSGKPIKLDQAATINLENYFSFESQQAQQISEIIERPSLSKILQLNLKAITFQLQFVDSSIALEGGTPCEPIKPNDPTVGVEINYVSLVAPFIQMSQ